MFSWPRQKSPCFYSFWIYLFYVFYGKGTGTRYLRIRIWPEVSDSTGTEPHPECRIGLAHLIGTVLARHLRQDLFHPRLHAGGRLARPGQVKKLSFHYNELQKNFSSVAIMHLLFEFDDAKTSSVCFEMDTFFTPIWRQPPKKKKNRCVVASFK